MSLFNSNFNMLIAAQLRCNGRQEYCELGFNQFTFPGSHSSGSGFDGPLRSCRTGAEQNGCIWQNQNRSIAEQLNLGIRFLTFDACILPDDCVDVYNGDLGESRLVACQGGESPVPFGGYRYAGLITQVLDQINDWMEDNRNEVIGVQFSRNSPDAQRSAVVREMVRLLEQRWCPNNNSSEPCSNSTDNLSLNTHYNQSGTWPTLAEAINTNSRIFVFINEALNVDNLETKWMNPAPISKYSFSPPTPTNGNCFGLLECAQQCNSTTELLTATGFMLGACNDVIQQDCNVRLSEYIEECYMMRQQYEQTINVILVNYPELGDAVFETSRLVNERNVASYLPSTTTQSITSSGGNFTTTGGCVMCVVSNMVLLLPLIVHVLIFAFQLV